MHSHFAGPRRRLAITCTVLLCLLPGCYWIGEPVTVGEYTSVAYKDRFGYVAVGPIVDAQFFGEIDGVGPGRGFTIYIPPLATVETVIAIGVATAVALPILAIESQGGDGSATGAVFGGVFDGMTEAMDTREHARSGFEGALKDATLNVVSDLSFDLAFAFTRHDDLDRGGGLSYAAILLGVRAAGARDRVPRIYLTGGLGWYSFNYDNRPNAFVLGPYAGLGAELFGGSERVSLGLEYCAHFYFGADSTGVPVDGGLGQLSALITCYW